MHNGTSIFGLVRDLKHEAKMFVREEIQLARTEVSEKISTFAGNATAVGIGGFVAYAGLIVLLCGLGVLVAFAFSKLGLSTLMSSFLGLGIIGLVVIATGTVMLMKGINGMKKHSLTPERTIESLQHLKGTKGQPVAAQVKTPEDKRTSQQIEADVLATEDRLAETAELLADRVTLGSIRRKLRRAVRGKGHRWAMMAAGCGAAGSYLLKRKLAK
jgi:hypothetical protein